jgi:hypothetical protein
MHAQAKKARQFWQLTLNRKTRLRKGDLNSPETFVQMMRCFLTMKINGGTLRESATTPVSASQRPQLNTVAR